MSFLEFMVSNTEYFGFSSLMGVIRHILWGLTWILTSLCNVVENIYNHIFSLFGVIYSDKVVNFLQGWIGYLWIPVAISILILGYNLIMGDATEGNARVKTFVRNLCLFAIVLFGLPYLFIGHGNTNNASVFTNPNANGYSMANNRAEYGDIYSGDAGLIDYFVKDNGSGIIKGVSRLSGNTNDGTHTYGIVADNTYDLKLIFLQVENRDKSEAKSTLWSQRVLEAGKIKKNIYQKTNSAGKAVSNADDSIMSLSINEYTDYELVDKLGQDKYKISDVMVDGYDYGIFFEDDNSKDDIHEYFINNEPNASTLTSNQYYKPQNVSLRQYLFKSYHPEVIRVYNSEGEKTSVWYSSNGKTQSGAIFGIGSNFPYRYKVEWGVMFIQLIATAVVMLLTSYKIARIIYEIVFNHFLALFFGAADLSNGQRIKEILKSIVSLLLSLLFAVVLVEFYFIVSDSAKTIQFIPNDETANKWMQALVQFFIAVATVKGPSVLEKILGVEGGLSGAWRDMGTATRPARRAAGAVARGAGKLAKGAAIVGAGAAYYGYNHHKGKVQAREENKNSNQNKIGKGKGAKGKDNSRVEMPGDAKQFSAINNGKQEKKLKPGDAQKGANGENAANEKMARQGRDLGNEVNNTAKSYQERDAIANRYQSNIHHSALAEQAKNGLDDKEALQRAYESSGFSKTEAESLANRDVTSGSFAETKDKFDNSISANAQERLANNPGDYSSEMEAYHAAASEHYRELGFDSSTAETMATSKAQSVLVDDKQSAIRSKAMEYQRGSDMSDVQALNKASEDVLGAESVGFKGSASEAASHIYYTGSLEEGVVSGRIANNAARESAETNTRSGSLNHSMNPGAKAAVAIVGGYFVERMAETLNDAGQQSGYNSYNAKQHKKDAKAYKKQAKK